MKERRKRRGWIGILMLSATFPRGALAGWETRVMQDDEIRWKAAELGDVDRTRRRKGQVFLEFIRVPDLSVGLYVLEAGAEDRQQPHQEDEIYYVVDGKGIISVDGNDAPVGPGSVVYLKAEVPHRFHSIEEDLRILVVFAPAFGSRKEARE